MYTVITLWDIKFVFLVFSYTGLTYIDHFMNSDVLSNEYQSD